MNKNFRATFSFNNVRTGEPAQKIYTNVDANTAKSYAERYASFTRSEVVSIEEI